MQKVNPSLMKRENKRIVLRYLIETGPHTRTEIAEHTGLAVSAVWRIIDELVREGFVEEKGTTSGAKKRAVLYGPRRSFVTSIVVNVEILETTVAIGFLDGSWRILERFETSRNFAGFCEKITKVVGRLRADLPLEDRTALVFSLPGIVNSHGGVLIYAPNLSWENINVSDVFREIGLQVYVENDSKLSLLAETFYMHDVKSSDVSFFLYFGEGIGGAISVNGKIVKGRNFAAGEIGHVILDSKKEVEQFLSVSGLISRVERKVKLGGTTLREKFSHLVQLWFSNSEAVREVLEEYLDYVAIVLRNVLYFLNPGVIVLGGIVNNLWENFGTIVRKKLEVMVVEKVLKDVIIRDTIFKEVPPSLVGGNVLAIERILREMC